MGEAFPWGERGIKQTLAGPSCHGSQHNTVTDTLRRWDHWLRLRSLLISQCVNSARVGATWNILPSARGRLPRKTLSLQIKAELLPPEDMEELSGGDQTRPQARRQEPSDSAEPGCPASAGCDATQTALPIHRDVYSHIFRELWDGR